MEAQVVFDEIVEIIELKCQCENYQSLLSNEELRAEKEEQRNRIAHWKSQTNLHPLPKHSHFQKPTWLRIRSNPKLR